MLYQGKGRQHKDLELLREERRLLCMHLPEPLFLNIYDTSKPGKERVYRLKRIGRVHEPVAQLVPAKLHVDAQARGNARTLTKRVSRCRFASISRCLSMTWRTSNASLVESRASLVTAQTLVQASGAALWATLAANSSLFLWHRKFEK